MLKISSYESKELEKAIGIITEWLEVYGEITPASAGGFIRYFSKQSKRQIRADVGTVFYNKIKTLLDSYHVECGDMVVTTGKRYKKIHIS